MTQGGGMEVVSFMLLRIAWFGAVLATLLTGCVETSPSPCVEQQQDVLYAPSDGSPENQTMLDIYGGDCSDDGSRPVLVWVHGGGHNGGDKANTPADLIKAMTGAGYMLVTANYRLSPDPPDLSDPDRVMHPVHVEDLARAIAYVIENAAAYGGDPQRLSLIGHSAGAHLVALVGTDPAFLQERGLNLQSIRCVASLDTAMYDIPQAVEKLDDDSDLLVMNAFGSDPQVWQDASPWHHVSSVSLDFLIARRGKPERLAIQDAFIVALEQSGVAVTVIDASSISHREVKTLIGAADDTVMTPPLMAFLAQCSQR